MCVICSSVLTSKQWEDRITSYRDFLQTPENDLEFLNKIITGDESWCFAYDPESKCQSVTWVGPWTPKGKKLCFKKSRVKTILVAFFNSQGLIHKEFVPTGQTVNANFYKDVLDRLIKRINRVHPDLSMSGNWFLQLDNTLAHNTALVPQFLAKKNVTILHHPPYLPIRLQLIISHSRN